MFLFWRDYLSKEQSQNQQPNDLRIRSKVISEGVSRTPNRSYLRALGFEDEDFEKPMIVSLVHGVKSHHVICTSTVSLVQLNAV